MKRLLVVGLALGDGGDGGYGGVRGRIMLKPLAEMSKEERLSQFLEELRLTVNRMNVQSNPGTIMRIASELSVMIERGPEHDEYYQHLRQFLDYRTATWDLIKVIVDEGKIRSTCFNSPEALAAIEQAKKALTNEGIKVE
ncbi:MAG TPA: hypothetical protein VN861_03530 [Candidatus Acidoferrales bacterium]|nr:hypothetical protein [Candidatus Acidoferrales bacterium]